MPQLALRWTAHDGQVTRPVEDGRTVIIGRDAGCDVVFDHLSVSRRHAEVAARDGHVFVRHLSATNPTRLNGRLLVGEAPLRPGDRLEVAIVSIEVVELGRASSTGQHREPAAP